MIVLVLVLILLLGWLIYSAIIPKFDFLESLGLSILLGLGSTSFLEFVLSSSGIGITKTSLIVGLVIGIMVLSIYQFLLWKEAKSPLENLSLQNFNIGSLNIIWIASFGLLLFVMYAITAKSLFWITFAIDSVSSFDLYAIAIAEEGNLLNSLIYDRGVSWGAAYPPLYSLLLAIPHMFGAESSKIIPALFFIGTVISFYSLLKNISNTTSAILFTLLMAITPEMLAQSAINITNVAQAAYSAIGVIALIVWIKTERLGYLWISLLLLAMNGFTRSEGVVYILPSIFVVFLWLFRKKDWKKISIYAIGTMAPFVIWQIFLKVNHDLMESFTQVDLQITPQFDTAKWQEIYEYTKFNLSQRTYFGITIISFIIIVIANAWFIIKKKDSWSILFITLSAILGYCLLLNQIDLKSGTMENIIKHSGKRFLFGAMILIWFYIASCGVVNKFMNFVHTALLIPKPSKK